jgi:hypothetical protein
MAIAVGASLKVSLNQPCRGKDRNLDREGDEKG